jgi:hypothetical protein
VAVGDQVIVVDSAGTHTADGSAPVEENTRRSRMGLSIGDSLCWAEINAIAFDVHCDGLRVTVHPVTSGYPNDSLSAATTDGETMYFTSWRGYWVHQPVP